MERTFLCLTGFDSCIACFLCTHYYFVRVGGMVVVWLSLVIMVFVGGMIVTFVSGVVMVVLVARMSA